MTSPYWCPPSRLCLSVLVVSAWLGSSGSISRQISNQNSDDRNLYVFLKLFRVQKNISLYRECLLSINTVILLSVRIHVRYIMLLLLQWPQTSLRSLRSQTYKNFYSAFAVENVHVSPMDYQKKWLVTRAFIFFFYVSITNVLNKQSSCHWFETPWRSWNVMHFNDKNYIFLQTIPVP